jgi:peptidoglycan/LPS O-acetylase OafA/YrhL
MPSVDTRNGFTLVRILAALSVIFTHGYGSVGLSGDFFSNNFNMYPLSKFGVDTFFGISGYLVMQSMLRNPNLGQYAVNRALRIFPGLAVAVVATIFVSAFFYTGTGYFTRPETWAYLKNISLFWMVLSR